MAHLRESVAETESDMYVAFRADTYPALGLVRGIRQQDRITLNYVYKRLRIVDPFG